MQIKLQTLPNKLILNSLKHKRNTILINTKINNKPENNGHKINHTALNLNLHLIPLTLIKIAHHLMIILNLFFGELWFGLIPNNVEVSFLFLVLADFYLLYILEGF